MQLIVSSLPMHYSGGAADGALNIGECLNSLVSENCSVDAPDDILASDTGAARRQGRLGVDTLGSVPPRTGQSPGLTS